MKIIDLQEFKKSRNLKKATAETDVPLKVDSFYKHKDLPLWIHVMGQRIPSLFGGGQMIMAQAHDGKVLCLMYRTQ